MTIQEHEPATGSGDEVREILITGSGLGNTFTLTFNGQTTVAIALGATAAAVQAALANLPSIGAEVHLPFGGVKQSGLGREGGRVGIDVTMVDCACANDATQQPAGQAGESTDQSHCRAHGGSDHQDDELHSFGD